MLYKSRLDVNAVMGKGDVGATCNLCGLLFLDRHEDLMRLKSGHPAFV